MFHTIRSNRILCNVIAAVVLLVIIIPGTWLVTDREPPLVLISGVAIPSAVVVGGTYRLKWTFKPANRACGGAVSWVLVDSERTRWTQPSEPTELNYKILNSDDKAVVGREHIVPSGAAPGPAIFKTTADFVCNFTQHWWPIHVEYSDVIINVLELPPIPLLPGPPGPHGPVGPPGPKGDPAPKQE